MQPSAKLLKTAKGLEEIDKRTYKLSGRLRAVMFMVDGQRTVEALLEQSGSMAEQLEAQLDELLALGFIEEVMSVEVGVETTLADGNNVASTARNKQDNRPLEATFAAAKPAQPQAPSATDKYSQDPNTNPLPSKPPARSAAPSAATALAEPTAANKPAAKLVFESVDVIKAKLSKMLAETMGMRAMFITSELNGLQTHAEIERFIDDTARSNSTTTGAKAAEAWRQKARVLSGYATTN